MQGITGKYMYVCNKMKKKSKRKQFSTTKHNKRTVPVKFDYIKLKFNLFNRKHTIRLS